MNYKVNRALDYFPKFKKQFINFISNPEIKLELLDGISISPSDRDVLILDVLDKKIELRFNIVSLDDRTYLGQISAFAINTYNEKFISEVHLLSAWFDPSGNIRSPEPKSQPMSHLEMENALCNFVVDVLSKLIDSDYFSPLTN